MNRTEKRNQALGCLLILLIPSAFIAILPCFMIETIYIWETVAMIASVVLLLIGQPFWEFFMFNSFSKRIRYYIALSNPLRISLLLLSFFTMAVLSVSP